MKYTNQDYIVTYTGKKVYPTHPSPESICIEDIAHALAHKCRWNGHTETFYSVAQHCVIVDTFFREPPLWGLLHDAAEAYLPDVASTVKQNFPTLYYAEKICFSKIAEKFKLPALSQQEKTILTRIDRAVLRIEWNALIDNLNGYDIGVDMTDVPQLHFELVGFWHPVEAERVFLKTFYEWLANKK